MSSNADRAFEVVSINVSVEKGTVKRPVDEAVIDGNGVVGDAHAGKWHRQVSILSREIIERFEAETGRAVAPGEFAENLTIGGIDLGRVSILDRLRVGDVELDVTQIGKKCHGDDCAVYREVGRCVMPKEGIFCRVVKAGCLRPGDSGVWAPRAMKIRIITLSDRAYAREYEDRAGPRVRELLESFFAPKRWHVEIATMILPDEPQRLRAVLRQAVADDVACVFTTGSTGVGPRDIAPEIAASVCQKTLPGIMENIRVKFGSEKPNALLSRGIAGVCDKTQIYTLPGSVRAVEEYVPEILKTLEHIIFMLHGFDVH